jgi:hypothetical protein
MAKSDKQVNIELAEEQAQEGLNVARAGRQQGNLVLEEEGNRIIDRALEHRRIWQSR